MCTVTVVRRGSLLRVACNRDESRRRPEAHPPFVTVAAGRHVLTPQDPQGGGTWIAANDAGLVLALINVHDERDTAAPRGPSRGVIIPRVADCVSIEELVGRLADVTPDEVAPCRLLGVERDYVVEMRLGGASDPPIVHSLDRPLLFTSSGLGDALVEGPRRALFEQMLTRAGDVIAQQDAFHAHRWRDRPALSVHMSRPDACTVSTTVVEVTPGEVRMIYHPAHFAEGTPVGLVLERQPVAHDAGAWPRPQYAAV